MAAAVCRLFVARASLRGGAGYTQLCADNREWEAFMSDTVVDVQEFLLDVKDRAAALFRELNALGRFPEVAGNLQIAGLQDRSCEAISKAETNVVTIRRVLREQERKAQRAAAVEALQAYKAGKGSK